ncbi:MAG: methionyl-tRNA formyltransferase, partial [Xanthomonadaceae bacterium]|nr:methionyl-tRNA formyltransferase [Xanthomonadaceae bacterium]
LRREVAIAPDDTGGSLHDKLAALGALVLGEGLRRALAGEALQATPQPEAGVTYAHKLEKTEARLDWNESASVLERKVRAFDPWPVAEADLAGERLRIWGAQAMPGGHAIPGGIVVAGKAGIGIACGEGILRVTKLQRAGGRVVMAADYLNARPELKRA